jgi:hypothetical protein
VALAPTLRMLAMDHEDFLAAYLARLEALDARALADELGDNAVLLCWEAPGYRCHRRLVAEWFEAELGVELSELGLARGLTSAFEDLPQKPRR